MLYKEFKVQKSGSDSTLFIPKALNAKFVLAGLLTYPDFLKPSHSPIGEQWQDFQKIIVVYTTGLHSSGYCPRFIRGSLLISVKLFHFNTKTKQR
jgi:hypothetical protein